MAGQKTGSKSNSKTNSGSKGKNGKIDSTYTRERKASAVKALNEESSSRRNEIFLFVYLAAAVFLVLSNFGLCGVAGKFVSRIFFGLLGTISYIIPIYIFFTAAFLLSNGAQKKIVKRVLCVAIFLVALAFVCQLLSGAEDVTIKSLYVDGAEHKRGGGVILGGLFSLLYKLIGMSGSVILIALLTIIGVIIVMDVSIVGMIKDSLDKEYDDDDEEDDTEADLQKRNKNKNMMNNIMVLESPESKKQKAKKKKVKVNTEEVHELKPLPPKDFFELDDLTYEEKQVEAAKETKPFEDKKQANKEKTTPAADIFAKAEAFPADKTEGLTASQEEAAEPVKRRRKKTKESHDEMVEARDSIANEINAGTEDAAKKQASPVGTSPESYRFPPIDLLKPGKGKNVSGNDASVRETAIKLKSTLENFGVNVTVTDYSCGPSVTRYEIQPEQGVKVSKIVNLADDIKLNLAAADIRIEAPIPGKAAVGIEVPNKESQAVNFRDLLESESFKKFPSKIAFAVGKDISGQVVVADIAKMPHLLVAGATGSGKSVCINTLIMSILYKARPDEVKLIMVDPKQVELSIYNGIPHMLIPVVTDPKQAAGALNWAVMEMTNRYQLFAQYNVRNLQGYNDKVKAVTGNEEGDEELKKLPQIVIIVDELADLMMVAHGEVEDAIVRLSQLARAAGIHLVIATQRPSVDVITGLIKANVPSRIAMTVSSGVDSRTILDMVGAEKLLGKGDMLFYPTGYPKPVRVQGAFLSDDEIADVVDFLKEQSGAVEYDSKITDEISKAKAGGASAGGSSSEYDDYFVDAGKFIIGKDKASIGMLQRVYKIGFNRAARIMDQLSEAGVVGPEEGTKPRKVLMSIEEFENYVEEFL
ncbi:MAG: DNA translocase FtsK [Clostridium sp.]|nr:DNA translocase FtsK [Clostridium sp.]MCM1400152.1 DNA translocase FtsK [Clostridium sp.]MCM1460884.1 DNA translocase FtsK [Bacteroides sp.]